MSEKQKRADALKELEAARKGSQKRMEQYDDAVSDHDSDMDDATIEELLEEKRSSMYLFL